MATPMTAEQQSLFDVASYTWRRRAAAKRTHLGFGEETITQTILLDLATNYPGELIILPFTKPQEGRVGADWAWSFESSDGSTSMPMLVQAKLLDTRDVDYPEIKRFIGRTAPPVRQIDRLIETAEDLRFPPVYAFYNHLNDISRVPDMCPSLPLHDYGHAVEGWGVTLADAYHVRRSLDDQTFDTHCRHSMPLHCLLCSGGRGLRSDGGSPDMALGGLRRLRAVGGEVAGPVEGAPELPDQPLEGSHPLFRMARSAAGSDDPRELDGARRAIAREFPGVDGVVILRDSKEPKPPAEWERRKGG